MVAMRYVVLVTLLFLMAGCMKCRNIDIDRVGIVIRNVGKSNVDRVTLAFDNRSKFTKRVLYKGSTTSHLDVPVCLSSDIRITCYCGQVVKVYNFDLGHNAFNKLSRFYVDFYGEAARRG